MRTLGRKGFLLLSLVPAATAVWALAHTSDVLAGRGPEVALAWAPSVGMHLDFRLDVLAWLMTLLVGGIGFFVLAYCTWYFANKATGLGRFASIFLAFAGVMLGLVTTDNTVALYVFWELTTIFSYLLVGHYFDRKRSEEHTSELQSRGHLVCRLLLEKKRWFKASYLKRLTHFCFDIPYFFVILLP